MQAHAPEAVDQGLAAVLDQEALVPLQAEGAVRALVVFAHGEGHGDVVEADRSVLVDQDLRLGVVGAGDGDGADGEVLAQVEDELARGPLGVDPAQDHVDRHALTADGRGEADQRLRRLDRRRGLRLTGGDERNQGGGHQGGGRCLADHAGGLSAPLGRAYTCAFSGAHAGNRGV